MPSITSIEPQKKKDRFNISVDGKFAFGLDAETLVKSGLRVGQEISEKEIEKLVLENETNKLMEKALRFLSFRPRSERELYNYLGIKIPKSLKIENWDLKISKNEIIDGVLGRLKRLGYVNDLGFSQWWVEQRQTHQPRGAQLIRSELYRKGIAQEIIDQVLPEDEKGEIERALAAAKKKLKLHKNLKPWEFKQKMGQYLARRGFDWETIKETLERLVESAPQK